MVTSGHDDASASTAATITTTTEATAKAVIDSATTTVLLPNDVIVGHGASKTNHEGNERFQTLLAQNRAEYITTFQYHIKQALANRVIDSVHASGGRFVQQRVHYISTMKPRHGTNATGIKTAIATAGLQGSTQKTYIVVSRTLVLEKVKRAFRGKSELYHDTREKHLAPVPRLLPASLPVQVATRNSVVLVAMKKVARKSMTIALPLQATSSDGLSCAQQSTRNVIVNALAHIPCDAPLKRTARKSITVSAPFLAATTLNGPLKTAVQKSTASSIALFHEIQQQYQSKGLVCAAGRNVSRDFATVVNSVPLPPLPPPSRNHVVAAAAMSASTAAQLEAMEAAFTGQQGASSSGPTATGRSRNLEATRTKSSADAMVDLTDQVQRVPIAPTHDLLHLLRQVRHQQQQLAIRIDTELHVQLLIEQRNQRRREQLMRHQQQQSHAVNRRAEQK